MNNNSIDKKYKEALKALVDSRHSIFKQGEFELLEKQLKEMFYSSKELKEAYYGTAD